MKRITPKPWKHAAITQIGQNGTDKQTLKSFKNFILKTEDGILKTENTWYQCGLHFECTGCGNCCAGPEEGYIWIVKQEIEFLAAHLGTPVEQVKQDYLKRIGLKHSIKENRTTKDCIFLTAEKGCCRGCAIYPVRPNQCRTWPFWSFNLHTPDQWNMAAARCPGINRGRFYSFEEIQTIMNQNQWWDE